MGVDEEMSADSGDVPQDYIEALKGYCLAAVQGLDGAQYALGLM